MISTDTAAILDPHKRYTGSGKRGWDGDLNEFLSHDGHAACFESHNCFGLKRGVIDYKATLFRFPLRKPDANSEISSNSYPVEKVRNFLFTSFIKEAPIILLFLKHVKEIGLYDGERLVYKVSIHPHHIRMVESERKALIELGLSNPKYSSLRLYSMSIVAEDAHVGSSSRSEYHWLIMNMIGSSFGNVNELSKKLVILPWVGIAAPLPRILHINNISLSNFNISQLGGILQHIQAKLKSHVISLPWCDGVQGHTDGHVFCFLPLPNITYLPVNIHGYFAVGDNRRSIEWPASDNMSDKAVWNQELVLKHIAPLYSMLLGCRSQLVRYTGTPLPLVNSQGGITDPYAAWPLWSEVRHKEIWSELVKPTITGSLDAPILWTAAEGGKWVKVTEAVFVPPTNEFPFPKEAVEVLLKANICVVSLPNKIRQTFTECKLGKHLQITVNPALVRQALKQVSIIPRDFNHLIALLECILHDINHDNCQDLVGITLVPLATRVFQTEVFKYTPHSNDEIVYVLESSMKMVLQFLPGVEHLVMNTTVEDSQSVYRVMIQLAKWGKLQLRLLTPESLCQTLLPISMKSWVSFKHHQSVKWQPGRKKSHPSVEWIKQLWSWLCRNPSTLGNMVGLPILPQQVVTPDDVQTITLLSLPSSKETYFVKQSGEEEERLGLMLQKMGATIVCENPFVFEHRRISQYILPMTVPNILQYLYKQGDPSKVSLLSSNEKSLLRSSIAQYYYRKSIPASYKSLLLQLPIYEVGVGGTPVSLVSLQYSSQYTLPDPNIEFDTSLNYPSDILNNQERDVVSLLSSLGYRYQNADDIYLSHILPFAVTQCNGSFSWCNGDRLIVWILNKVSILSPQLKHFFGSQQFIRTKAMFGVCKKASELYNPNDEQFQNLFDAAEDKVFPADIYQEKGVMHKLLSLGIISWRNLAQSEDNLVAFLRARAESVKYVSHDVALKRSCYILELIGTYRQYSEYILAQIQMVEFLHVETKVPTSFPSFLPWHGASRQKVLEAPNKLCFETTNSCLAGSVLSVMSGYYREHLQVQLPSNVVRFFLTPSIGDVIQQLQVLVHSVKTRNLQTVESKQVSRMVHDIYAHLNANSKDVVATTLPSHWIWWKGENEKYTFMHPKKFVLDSPIPLSPFICNIQSDRKIGAYKNLLKISGIRTAVSSMDIVKVLQEISSSFPTNVPDKFIKMAVAILHHLQQWKYQSSGDILLPTTENKLHPANQCTYDDREWIKKRAGAGISKYNFVHDDIPPNTARYFGVEPLSKRVAPSQRLRLGYTQVGPKERVTRRISGIVKDYSGNIDVFKELIQNADDAGASEVKLLVDWRYHGQEYLFENEMKHWQGPALVAYNNATFSDQDFDNICELAAETKMSDPLKTGRFGVGFCACYSLTDVPSFISRHYFTIFDPHTKYLGERVSHNEPGMRLDVVEQQEGLKIYEHQFAPFDGLFDCQIFDLHGDGFNGTIFRLPLRMAGAPKSEITNEHYDHYYMNKRVADLQKEAAKLLLFLKRVQVLGMFELGEGAKSGTEMKLLFKVEKNSQNPSARIEMIQQYITSPEIQQKPICNICKITVKTSKSRPEILQYLQASAIDATKVSSKKGMIPLAELAVEITDNGFPISCKDGRLFCFLPLPLDSFLPFHVNGYFDVGKDRRGLKEAQNSPEYNWNKSLIENALPLAFECVLGHITKQPKLVRLDVDSKNNWLKAYYSLWPGAYSKIFNTAGRSWVSEVFANSVKSVLQESEESLLWSEVNGGKWISPSDAYIFENDSIISLPQGIKNNAVELLLAEGFSIIDIEHSQHVARLLHAYMKAKNHLFNYKRFFEDVFIPNILNIDSSTRNKQLLYVLKNISDTMSFKWARDILKNNCCIPVAGSSKLARPDQLIDVHCKPIACLYDTGDDRFPEEEFAKSTMGALVILGIITKELPVSELSERAETVNVLNEEEACKRMKNILQYVEYIEHSEYSFAHYGIYDTSRQNSSKRKERIAVLHKIPFLKALPKPEESSIPWYETENRFLCPSELYSPNHYSLVFNQKPIFQPLSTETNIDTEKIVLYLGIDEQEPEVEIVLNNLCRLIESLKGTQIDSKTIDLLHDEKIFQLMYEFLNSKCRSEHAELIKTKLSNTPCIWQEGRFHSPDQMLFSWEGKSCFPYLGSLSSENKTFEELFQLIGVEREATVELLSSILTKMFEDHDETSLSNELLDFVDTVTKKLEQKYLLQNSPQISQEIFLPDEEGILRHASKLSCDSNLKEEWIQSLPVYDEFLKKGGHFIHESIPRARALNLGAYVIIDAVLKDIEDNDFLDGTDFGQHEELVDRLNGILKKYPPDTSIFKEFIQNADDAKASEIVFVLDQRTDHLDRTLLSETEKWKELQHTPALCIFNNRPFTEEDIQGICRLGRGGKGDTADTIGRFGIGFNVAYHLTDCPSFVSYNPNGYPNDFCVFDPLRKYCPKANSVKPGRRWKTSDRNLEQFPDQFHPFLTNKIPEMQTLIPSCLSNLDQGFTVFRLPLVRWKPESKVNLLYTPYGISYSSFSADEKEEMWLKEGRASAVYDVKDLVKQLKQSSENMLLFLNHIKHISVFEIHQNGKCLHHFTTTSTEDMGSTYLSKVDTKPVSLSCEITLHHHITTDDDSVEKEDSKWIINKRFGLPAQDQFRDIQVTAKERGLEAFGGIAAQLGSTSPLDGSLFCFLPMNIRSCLPVHLNAHFLIDDSRKHLDKLPNLGEWNPTVAEHILVPSYIDLILKARDHVDESEETIKWFYNLFPNLISDETSEASSLKINHLLYEHLINENYPILLDKRCIANGEVNWLQINSGDIGYFCLDFYRFGYVDRDPTDILLSLGMPITCAPDYIFKSLCKISKDYSSSMVGLVTPDKVVQHLRDLDITEKENVDIIKENCKVLLKFCLSNCSSQKIKTILTGTPLLLTLAGTLDSSGSLFESKYSSLLPHCYNQFINPSLERSVGINKKLRDGGVIVNLPVHVVAREIQLSHVDEPVELSDEDKYLVRLLWQYLEYLIMFPSLSDVITKCFNNKPIIPASQGTFYPPSLGKSVFLDNPCLTGVLSAVKKLGYHTVDFSKVGFHLAPSFMHSLVSEASSPSDMIKCLQLCSPKLTNEVSFTATEANGLINLFSQCHTIPPDIATILKRLPLFETANRSYMCLSDAKKFFIMPLKVPDDGILNIQRATQQIVLHPPGHNAEQFYNKIISEREYASAKPSTIQFYLQFLIPNFNNLTDNEMIIHLRYIRSNFFQSTLNILQKEKEDLVEILKRTPLITKDGKRFLVSEFYDPAVKYHVAFNKTKLPPPEWSTDEWIQFLRQLGLQRDVDNNAWLSKAKKTADDAAKLSNFDKPSKELIEQSESLISSLKDMIYYKQKQITEGTIEHLDINFVSFLTKASKIRFIYCPNPCRLEVLLQTVTNRRLTHYQHFTLFHEAVYHKSEDLAGLFRAILPTSCDFLTQTSNIFSKALSVREPLNVKTVIKNLIALSEALSCNDAQVIVPSYNISKAIRCLKEIFEKHYEFLEENFEDKAGIYKELLSERCILLSPDNLSFILVKPAQLVIHYPKECDFRPFCYSAPPELLKYNKLLRALGIKQELEPLQYLDILDNIREEMNMAKKQLNEDQHFLQVCKDAYNALILLIRRRSSIVVIQSDRKIYLPSEDYELLEVSQLVHNDIPWIATRLQESQQLRYKFLCPPPPDNKGQKIPPPCLRVKLLSQLAVEELHKNVCDRINKCTDQELYDIGKRPNNCQLVSALQDTFTSKEFSKGIGRLYWHEHQKHPKSNKSFCLALKAATELSIQCVNCIETIVKFNGKEVPGAEDKTHLCHLKVEAGNLTLIVAHKAQQSEDLFWEQLAALVNKHLDRCIPNESHIKAILRCHPNNIQNILNKREISTFDTKSFQSGNEEMEVGYDLSDVTFSKEDLLIICNFEEGEKVLYHSLKEGKPVFNLAKIVECPLKTTASLSDKCIKLHVGTNKGQPIVLTVSLFQVYKILNTSQRQSLTSDHSSRFSTPLIMAMLPEQKDELSKWLRQIFLYNGRYSCCSASQLSQRIVAHMHYVFLTRNKCPDLFLPAARFIVEIMNEGESPACHQKPDDAIKEVTDLIRSFEELSIEDDIVFGEPMSPLLADKIPMAIDYKRQMSTGGSNRFSAQPKLAPSTTGPTYSQSSVQISRLSGIQVTGPTANVNIPSVNQRFPFINRIQPSLFIPSTPSGGEINTPKPQLNPENAKVWLQQAKADYMAARDIFITATEGEENEDSDEDESRSDEMTNRNADIMNEMEDYNTLREEGSEDEVAMEETYDIDTNTPEDISVESTDRNESGEDNSQQGMEEAIEREMNEQDEETEGEEEVTSQCRYPALVCFLSHEVVEKCIKGIMYAKCGPPDRLLDCSHLKTLCDKLKSSTHCPRELVRVVEECSLRVIEHGNKSRYPNYHYPPCTPASVYTVSEGAEALKAAGKLLREMIKDPELEEMIGELDVLPEHQFRTALSSYLFGGSGGEGK